MCLNIINDVEKKQSPSNYVSAISDISVSFNWRDLEINACYRFYRDFATNGRTIFCLMLLSELQEQELRNLVISKNTEYFSSPSTFL